MVILLHIDVHSGVTFRVRFYVCGKFLRQSLSYFFARGTNDYLIGKGAIMSMQGISNNRDGMALRVLSEKLSGAPQSTKLLISLSDGQPKAMPDYSGNSAAEDMKQIIKEYNRKGVIFLAAAIGQDKDAICQIYGQERFIDISDLKQLPIRLVQIIARYL